MPEASLFAHASAIPGLLQCYHCTRLSREHIRDDLVNVILDAVCPALLLDMRFPALLSTCPDSSCGSGCRDRMAVRTNRSSKVPAQMQASRSLCPLSSTDHSHSSGCTSAPSLLPISRPKLGLNLSCNKLLQGLPVRAAKRRPVHLRRAHRGQPPRPTGRLGTGQR